MSGLEDLVRSHPFVTGFGEAVVDEMVECAIGTRDLSRDEMLFEEGRPAERLYLVLEGDIALEVHFPGGTPPRVVQTVHAGDALGWSWLFPPHRWSFDARAVTAARVLEMDGVKMRACTDEKPDLGLEVMKRFALVVVDRLQATRLQLLDLYARRT